MRLTLDIRKSVEENAAFYFEKAKKDKKKIIGARKAVDTYKNKLGRFKQEKVEKKVVVKKRKKTEWFEKFRWFISSDDFLVIGGRDATTNEIIIKKYTEKDDLVFHTDMAGSPFIVIKNDNNKATSKAEPLSAQDKSLSMPETTRREAAIFTAVFSRGWKQGLGTIDVFHVKPEQVSKKANSGEYLAKGSFMIYGETTYYHPEMSYAIGIYKDKVMGGPLSAVKKHCKKFIEILQGNDKQSDVAKQIRKELGGELDDILRAMPVGCKIKK